jgi:hypothetical protein
MLGTQIAYYLLFFHFSIAQWVEILYFQDIFMKHSCFNSMKIKIMSLENADAKRK